MSNEPIDVLTVMYAGSLVLASHGADKSADAINEARAAVAELMEAAEGVAGARIEYGDEPELIRLNAALARVRGAA